MSGFLFFKYPTTLHPASRYHPHISPASQTSEVHPGPPLSLLFPSFSPSTPPSCYHLRLETSPEPFIPLLAVSLSTLSHHPAVPPIAPSLQLPTPRHPLPFGITPCVKWISPGEIYCLQDAPQRAKGPHSCAFFPYSYSVFGLFDMLRVCDSVFRKWEGCAQSCEYSEVWSKQLDQQSACTFEEPQVSDCIHPKSADRWRGESF